MRSVIAARQPVGPEAAAPLVRAATVAAASKIRSRPSGYVV